MLFTASPILFIPRGVPSPLQRSGPLGPHEGERRVRGLDAGQARCGQTIRF